MYNMIIFKWNTCRKNRHIYSKHFTYICIKWNEYIDKNNVNITHVCTLGWFQKQLIRSRSMLGTHLQGANERVLLTDFKSVFKRQNPFFSDFFHQRVPPLVFENFDLKWGIERKCQEKNKNRFEISEQNSFICPLWTCSSMLLDRISCFWNHPNIHPRSWYMYII